jgi:hypothetical protein
MMKIVHSTSSHVSAGESDGTRETMRFGAIQAKGVVLPDDYEEPGGRLILPELPPAFRLVFGCSRPMHMELGLFDLSPETPF